MGVYIKGIEIPKESRLTLQISADGAVYVVNSCSITAETYMTDAVPVPPHGRLIEEEPIIKYITDGLNIGRFGYDAIEVLAEIKYAPTIIPAEEGE